MGPMSIYRLAPDIGPVDAYDAKLLGLLKELGDIVMQDDRGPDGKSDIGKFDRLHHWHLGAVMKYGADLIRWGVAISEIQRLMGAPANTVDFLEAELLRLTNGTRY